MELSSNGRASSVASAASGVSSTNNSTPEEMLAFLSVAANKILSPTRAKSLGEPSREPADDLMTVSGFVSVSGASLEKR